MQIGGKSKRVTLVTDLTRYNEQLTEGVMGNTVPDIKFGSMGNFDHFVAVKFDNGVEMDILYDSLKY